MKKKRGLKRYFKSLQFQQTQIPVVCINDGYFSYDKIWLDHYGFNGINKRKPHLDCLFRNFDILADQISRLSIQFQIWIWINEETGKEDCIILHSPNPFTSFPHKYQNLSPANNFNNSDLLTYINRKTDFKKLFGTSFHENDNGKQVKKSFCILYKDIFGESVI